MKQTFFILSIALSILLLSCNSAQNDAGKMAEQIQSAVKENTPGSIPTTTNGYTMTAKIDGKEWKATGIMPPDKVGIIFGEKNGESISLPYYDRRSFLAETKIKFRDGFDGRSTELRLNDKIVLYSGTKGEMEITKVDDNMAEGKFHCTATGFQSDKTVEVTDGFFRILWK